MALISPSLLSADFAHLGKSVEMLNNSESDYIHMDVMDGVFVPNISFGFPVIKAVSKIARHPLDVHLMIVNPDRYISQVRDAGAAIMNVHVEACNHLHRVIQQIKHAGMKAAVTLNPSTPLVMLEDIITDVDMVLLMSVNPGFAGQSFIENSVDKTLRLRQMIDDSDSDAIIEVDGGINLETGRRVIDAGADMLVSGNYIFNSSDSIKTIHELKAL